MAHRRDHRGSTARGYLATGAGGYFTELDQLTDADWDRMRAMIKAKNEKDRAGRTT